MLLLTSSCSTAPRTSSFLRELRQENRFGWGGKYIIMQERGRCTPPSPPSTLPPSGYRLSDFGEGVAASDDGFGADFECAPLSGPRPATEAGRGRGARAALRWGREWRGWGQLEEPRRARSVPRSPGPAAWLLLRAAVVVVPEAAAPDAASPKAGAAAEPPADCPCPACTFLNDASAAACAVSAKSLRS